MTAMQEENALQLEQQIVRVTSQGAKLIVVAPSDEFLLEFAELYFPQKLTMDGYSYGTNKLNRIDLSRFSKGFFGALNVTRENDRSVSSLTVPMVMSVDYLFRDRELSATYKYEVILVAAKMENAKPCERVLAVSRINFVGRVEDAMRQTEEMAALKRDLVLFARSPGTEIETCDTLISAAMPD